MELAQIRYVLMVSQYNNFSKAADQLYITQPTLSQQIRRLEEELGFPLFVRSTRSVSLTDEGKIFVNYAKPLVADYNALIQEMEALKKDVISRLSVGVLPTFSHLNLLNLIQMFQKQYTTITISTELHSSNDLIEKLINEHLDIIVANVTPMQKSNLEHEVEIHVVSQDHINVILNEKNPLSTCTALSLEDIRNEPIIMLGKGSSIYRQINLAFKSAGIIPAETYPCPELHSMIGMIQSNTGIGFLSSRVAAEYVHSPIVSIPFTPELPTMTAIMYLKKHPNLEPIQMFFEYAKDVLQKLC